MSILPPAMATGVTCLPGTIKKSQQQMSIFLFLSEIFVTEIGIIISILEHNHFVDGQLPRWNFASFQEFLTVYKSYHTSTINFQ